MRKAIELLRQERRARVFFAALAQSSLGNGAAYVALLLIAFDRLDSPWALSAVLIADLLPAMVFGPIFGAIADRFSRRACCVVADLLRAAAFCGIALVDSFEATVALALVAGVGTALFTPAALAALPSLVDKQRLPPATALFGMFSDLGFTVGPALAAVGLLLGGPEVVLWANAVTFLASGIVLAGVRFGAVPDRQEPGPKRKSLLGEAREGMGVARRLPLIRFVLVASGAVLFCAGIFNVAELPFVEDELGGDDATFAILVGLFGLGFAGGSLLGSSGGELAVLRRRYLIGLLLTAMGLLALAAVPVLGLAFVAFTAAGVGNGMMLVYERLLIQAQVPERLTGRIFGVKDAITAWAFALAFLAAGGLIATAGVRTTMLGAGAAALVVLIGSIFALRKLKASAPGEGSGGDADSLGEGVPREDRPDLVNARGHWLTILDDLEEGDDDGGVELGPSVAR
jgi:MFS family permease